MILPPPVPGDPRNLPLEAMIKVAVAALLTALTPALAAQKDRIVWTDGTVTEKVKIQDFTWREVSYSTKGRAEQRPADSVARLEVAKAKDTYRRAYGASTDEDAYTAFLNTADRLAEKDPFLAQWGYLEAARLNAKRGEYSSAFANLETMVSKLPDCGFYPELFRFKLEYYLAQGKAKAKDAAAVAKTYNQTAVQKGWPDGFVHEASFFGLMAQSASESLSEDALKTELENLLAVTEGAYPSVADRVKILLADGQRKSDDLASARKTYEELIAKEGVDENTRARAFLGLGHSQYAAGDRTNTEPYREALLSFLKVYLETTAASDELKAEALFFAAESSEKWRGPDAAAMARRLRGYLKRDYGDTQWAQR